MKVFDKVKELKLQEPVKKDDFTQCSILFDSGLETEGCVVNSSFHGNTLYVLRLGDIQQGIDVNELGITISFRYGIEKDKDAFLAYFGPDTWAITFDPTQFQGYWLDVDDDYYGPDECRSSVSSEAKRQTAQLLSEFEKREPWLAYSLQPFVELMAMEMDKDFDLGTLISGQKPKSGTYNARQQELLNHFKALQNV